MSSAGHGHLDGMHNKTQISALTLHALRGICYLITKVPCSFIFISVLRHPFWGPTGALVRGLVTGGCAFLGLYDQMIASLDWSQWR